MGRFSFIIAAIASLTLFSCDGDFDQRVDVAKHVGEGSGSIGSTANPSGGTFVRGNISIGGAVRNARVVLRPVLQDGSIDFDDTHALASTVSFSSGIYHGTIRDKSYRGPIVVEVRGQNTAGTLSIGANPATSRTATFHTLDVAHTMYGVLPFFDGYSVGDVNVSPLTTCAVMRSQFLGGISAGMYGMTLSQVSNFFALNNVRNVSPTDLTGSGSFGNNVSYGYLLAALSQVARNVGVTNVFDFYEGMGRDCLDDGILNGSIGLIPNTGIAMPDLTVADLLRDALFDDYLAPGNVDRFKSNPDNTNLSGEVGALVNALAGTRNINGFTYAYEFVLRVPTFVTIDRGGEHETRVFAVDQFGSSTFLECYGDSGGPSFVDYQFVSSSPTNVVMQSFGRITAPIGATPGVYNVALTVTPAAAQTFITGPTKTYNIGVRVK